MKNYFLIAIFIFLFLGLIFIQACSNNNNTPVVPLAIPSPTPTFTVIPTSTWSPTATPTVSIFWYSGTAWRTTADLNPPNMTSSLYLQVNGLPDSSAIIFLSGTNISSPVTLSYSNTVTIPGPGTVCAYYSVNGGWTYQVGAFYTMTCIAMGVTSTATLSAPGNITVATDTSGAITLASWTTEGNSDLVEIYLTTTKTFSIGPDIDSPVTIDSLTPYPTPGSYNSMVSARNFTTSVSNATANSAFSVIDTVERNFTK